MTKTATTPPTKKITNKLTSEVITTFSEGRKI